ncbi:hypothetical protein OIU85_027233 [Salix viminalis]|uniref:Uncharacterized protein n=1 Tax=Salix viminalis TaxID=40686 RepID=A0A9Q0QHV7_SALVM|nr:hypothetical protein OIU85_027233 [Salix viminalis]
MSGHVSTCGIPRTHENHKLEQFEESMEMAIAEAIKRLLLSKPKFIETIRQTNSGICKFDSNECPCLYLWNSKNARATKSDRYVFNIHGYAYFQPENTAE